VDASGKKRIVLNVPPGQNWSQAVLEVVIVYVAAWVAELEAG